MSTPRHAVSVSLAAGTRAPAEARATIDSLPVGLLPEVRRDLRLAVSELVTSNVLHVCGPNDQIDLQVTAGSGVIRCEVGTHHPRPFKGPAGALALVDRIASRWGMSRHGRSVWFELDDARRRGARTS